MIEAPAARAAEERAVKTMRVSTLIVEKEAEHKTVAHAMTFPPYTWGII